MCGGCGGGKDLFHFNVFPSLVHGVLPSQQTHTYNTNRCHKYLKSTLKQTNHLLHTQRYKPNTQTCTTHILPPTVSLWENIVAQSGMDVCGVICIYLLVSIKTCWEFVSMNVHQPTHLCTYVDTEVHECLEKCTGAWRHIHAQGVCVCEGSVCQCDVCGGPSGHPCLAVVPVKCCQRGRCGLPWRLKACCTALPAQAADLRKGNLGRWNGGVAPELFTEPSTGPAPPTIFHMRTSVCVVPVVWCVCECWGLMGGLWGGKCACVCECKCLYEEMQALYSCLQACLVGPGIQMHVFSLLYQNPL